jgi:4-hydroxy-3-methylbut-2-enyl diphosphate reductase
MRIRLAKTAGFCMGVRRAVDIALDLQRGDYPAPIVTYGPLIHNPATLELLRSRGVDQVSSLDEIHRGTVVIRAHGISPGERESLAAKNVVIVDATCPRVAKVQAIIRKHARQGHPCVIVGDADHPEVKGLLGHAAAGGVVVASGKDVARLDRLPFGEEICVVSQTTQEQATFHEVVAAVEHRARVVHSYNTICNSTNRRQNEVTNLARHCDLVVVVGGKNSGNTSRLAKLVTSMGVPALHVEGAEEIPESALDGKETVGVTAGASTPNWQIRQVMDRLKEISMSRWASPVRRLRRLFDVSVMTYLWAAAGGGGLTAACMVMQRQEISWLPLAAAFLFVFSMHVLNRTMDRSGAVRFNTPEVAAYYVRHRTLLTSVGALGCGGAALLAWCLGIWSFAVLAGTILGGLFYTASAGLAGSGPIRQWFNVKEIPGSKAPLVAFGWAIAAAVTPALRSPLQLSVPATLLTTLFAAGLVLFRSALSDLLDIQGDRIVGRETIPILIGSKRTGQFLRILLVVLGVMLVSATWGGVISPAGYVLTGNVILFWGLLLICERGHQVDRLWFESLLDGNLVLAGAMAIVYGMA